MVKHELSKVMDVYTYEENSKIYNHTKDYLIHSLSKIEINVLYSTTKKELRKTRHQLMNLNLALLIAKRFFNTENYFINHIQEHLYKYAFFINEKSMKLNSIK